MGWIFQGNPKKYDIDDYLSRYPELIYWRTPRYKKDIAVGDRTFIWRAGYESGVIAIGIVVEAPTPAKFVKHPEALGDDLWVAGAPLKNESMTGIHIVELRLTIEDEMLAKTRVVTDPILDSMTIIKMPSGTVFKLSETETQAMELLWGIKPSLSSSISSEEGEQQLRSHYVRERSSRLRADKLRAFRETHKLLHCEICGEVEAERYPLTYSEKIFEVHHKTPLYVAITPVRTTLDDLAVLCANCHRTVHVTKNVDDNYKLLLEHFTK